MAVRTPTYPKTKQSNLRKVLWEGLTGADTGLPVRLGKYTDKTVHIYALTGHGGGTTVLQGSNDPRADPTHASHASAIWTTLTDGQGTTISKTADAIEVVQENPEWIRPSQSGGTAADVVVAVTCKRTP
jgi:hypothetical protein